MAVMATFAYSQAGDQSASVITGAGEYEGNSLILDGTIAMQGESESLPYDEYSMLWYVQSGEASMSGNGRIYSIGEPWCLDIWGEGESFSIGEGVTLENVDIVFDSENGSRLAVYGSLKDVALHTSRPAEVDISSAAVSGAQNYELCSGTTLITGELNVKENVFIEVYNSYNEETGDPAGGSVTLRGNLVLNGSLPALTEEQRFDYSYEGNHEHMEPYGAVQFWVSHEEGGSLEPFVSINVTGSITIKSETAIVFANEGDWEQDDNNRTTWYSDYRLPTATDVLFICSSVNEESLSLLKPYAYREDSWADYSGENEVLGGYEYIKPVDDREFYAKAGADGKVYIYLGDASSDSGDDIQNPATPEPELTIPSKTIVINTSQPDMSEYEMRYKWADCNLTLNGNWLPQTWEDYDDEGLGMYWTGSDANTLYSMTGSGTIGNMDIWTELFIDGAGKFSIGSGITFVNTEICVAEYGYGAEPEVSIEASLKDCEMYVGRGVLDISKADLSPGYNWVEIAGGATLRVSNFEINKNTWLTVYGDQETPSRVEGNLIINSSTAGYYGQSGEVSYTWDKVPALGCVEFYGDSYRRKGYGCLTVTGNITVAAPSIILYVSGQGYTEGDAWVSDYLTPQDNHLAFICSGVTKNTLDYLMPVMQKTVDSEQYDEETGELLGGSYVYYYKALSDRKFYAKAGADGKVYIYLGTTSDKSDESVPSIPGDVAGGGSQPTPPAPTPSVPESSIVVGTGDTVILGKDEDTTPSKDKPIHIQGGIADASGLAGDLLNNKVIQGTSGTLKTGADQKMEITGSGSLNYGIVGADDKTPGADLDIKLGGQLELKGKQYNTAKATISGGVLSINSGSTLGMGTGETAVDVQSGASLTNFGKVAGDVALAGGSTMLNQNKVEGDVLLQGKSTMVNNGSVSGTVTVSSDALLSGTGMAGAAALCSGASMHVGNSPGYQKYGSLTIDRGASISFTVDGTQGATLEHIGEGTHSVLEADTLTINAGEGTVALDVEVTMGIVAAGSAPIEVTLVEAGTGNAAAADFSINLEDNGLLEEGAEVTWDSATQSLTLSGSVSKAALAALMDSNSANVANTMWASANAVQEMARTAESQVLIGMPGQTT